MNKEIVEAIEIANKPLLQALDGVKNHLQAIARISMLQVLYERAEVKHLAAEYNALRERAHRAGLALNQAHDDLVAAHGNFGYEERVKKFGEDQAQAQNAPMTAAFEARKATNDAVASFAVKHPLIAELVLGSGPLLT